MATVVVTGATGFIGGHLARQLHGEGFDVRATGRDTAALAALQSDGIATQPSDLAVDPLDALLRDADVLIHAAALSSPWGRRDAFIAANVTATQRVLLAAQRAGVRRVIHLSSPSIYYRPVDQLDVPEAFSPPQRWITHYAESKWLSEQLVHDACADTPNLSAAILRPRAVFGDGDRAIFPRLIAAAARGRLPLVDGGRALIDVTHVDNVVQAVRRAIDAPLPTPVATFNISNGEPMRVRDLFDTLFGALAMDVRYVSLPRPLAMIAARLIETAARLHPRQPEPPVSRYTLGVLAYAQTLDISAARHVLGYAPTTRVREGITRFADAWRHAHAVGAHDHRAADAGGRER